MALAVKIICYGFLLLFFFLLTISNYHTSYSFETIEREHMSANVVTSGLIYVDFEIIIKETRRGSPVGVRPLQ